jgi:hypothetical protein
MNRRKFYNIEYLDNIIKMIVFVNDTLGKKLECLSLASLYILVKHFRVSTGAYSSGEHPRYGLSRTCYLGHLASLSVMESAMILIMKSFFNLLLTLQDKKASSCP